MLLELLLSDACGQEPRIEQQGARRGRALVQGENMRGHGVPLASIGRKANGRQPGGRPQAGTTVATIIARCGRESLAEQHNGAVVCRPLALWRWPFR